MQEAEDNGNSGALALAMLTGAVLRCPDEDVRTAEVLAALDRLDRLTGEAATVKQFRAALDLPDRWARFKQARDALTALERALVGR
jgi:hypothetical protein